jgi:hypothetical protein
MNLSFFSFTAAQSSVGTYLQLEPDVALFGFLLTDVNDPSTPRGIIPLAQGTEGGCYQASVIRVAMISSGSNSSLVIKVVGRTPKIMVARIWKLSNHYRKCFPEMWAAKQEVSHPRTLGLGVEKRMGKLELERMKMKTKIRDERESVVSQSE